jgi:hypothetical protein
MSITDKLQKVLAQETRAVRRDQQEGARKGKDDAEYARETRADLKKQEEILNGYVIASQVEEIAREAAEFYQGTIYRSFLYKVSSKSSGTWYRYALRKSDLLPDRKVNVSRVVISILWDGGDKTTNYVEVSIGLRGWIWIQYESWPIPSWEWKIRPEVVENRLVEALQKPSQYRDPAAYR